MTEIKITSGDLTPDGRLKKQYPDIDSSFSCNMDMTSLIGSPVKISDSFYAANTKITSLIGAPIIVGGSCYFSGTKISSLQGIGKDYLREIGRILYLNSCFDLKSQLLGIMLVKKLKRIYFNPIEEVEEIFNRHLYEDRDLLDCKEELMNAGFKEFAKL